MSTSKSITSSSEHPSGQGKSTKSQPKAVSPGRSGGNEASSAKSFSQSEPTPVKGDLLKTSMRVAARIARAVAAALVVLNRQEVLGRVLEVVGAATGQDPGNFTRDTVLRDSPASGGAGFDDQKVMGLTTRVNKEFADVALHLTINQVGDSENVKTIADLRDLIWENLSPEHKETNQ